MSDSAVLEFDRLTTPRLDALLPVAAHWSGFGGAHGGLMVAALGRTMERAAGRPLRSIHADLHSAVRPGELQVSAALDRVGRQVTYASAEGRQEGALRLRASGVFGKASTSERVVELAVTDAALAMPDVPSAVSSRSGASSMARRCGRCASGRPVAPCRWLAAAGRSSTSGSGSPERTRRWIPGAC